MSDYQYIIWNYATFAKQIIIDINNPCLPRLPDEGKVEEQNLVLFLVKLMLATNVNPSLPILPDEGKVEEQNLVLFSETDADNKCKSLFVHIAR